MIKCCSAELIFIYQILRACKNVAGSDLLLCREATLSEWNLDVPQGDVAQDNGEQVHRWLGGVTSSTKSKICRDSICHDVISTMTCNRLIHGFTCAGMLPSQYYHFSQFSGIGVVGSWYVQAGKYVKT